LEISVISSLNERLVFSFNFIEDGKCIDYEAEGLRPTGRPKTTWSKVVEKRLLENV